MNPRAKVAGIERALVAGIEGWLMHGDEESPIPEPMAKRYLRARHALVYTRAKNGRVRSAWKMALANSVGKGSVVFDIGANIGLISQPASWLVGKQGAVHAFEPSPGVSARLRRRVELLGLHNVTVNDFAVGRAAAEATLFEYDSFHGGASSLRPETSVSGPHDRETEVRVESIDTYVASHGIARLDFMKIDVEGAEIEVLAGAKRAIERFRPVMFVEASAHTLAAFGHSVDHLVAEVESFGYRAYAWRTDALLRVAGADDIPPEWQHDDLICLDPVRHRTIVARLEDCGGRRQGLRR